jgi:hypothetical protein
MRTIVSALLFGVCLVAGPAQAQQNPWVPSGSVEPIGSLPNGTPAQMQNPWVPSGYRGSVPDDAAFASGRTRGGDSAPRRPAASQRNTGDTK